MYMKLRNLVPDLFFSPGDFWCMIIFNHLIDNRWVLGGGSNE